MLIKVAEDLSLHGLGMNHINSSDNLLHSNPTKCRLSTPKDSIQAVILFVRSLYFPVHGLHHCVVCLKMHRSAVPHTMLYHMHGVIPWRNRMS